MGRLGLGSRGQARARRRQRLSEEAPAAVRGEAPAAVRGGRFLTSIAAMRRTSQTTTQTSLPLLHRPLATSLRVRSHRSPTTKLRPACGIVDPHAHGPWCASGGRLKGTPATDDDKFTPLIETWNSFVVATTELVQALNMRCASGCGRSAVRGVLMYNKGI